MYCSTAELLSSNLPIFFTPADRHAHYELPKSSPSSFETTEILYCVANPPINLFHITNKNLICIRENICDLFPLKDIAEMPRKE
jgi:hypothetical protein